MASSGSSSSKCFNTLRQLPPQLPESEHNQRQSRRHIRFRHPGYPDVGHQNILLGLYAFDHPDGGLHYGTAFLACAIVAANAFDGYLSETRAGPKLEPEWDQILFKDDYYFHVPPTQESASPAHEYQYPVYPTFQHWSFPHTNMPANWPDPLSPSALALTDLDLAPPSASALAAYVLRRDKNCLITSSKDYIENAHLCPREEDEWFKRNSMADYNINRVLGNYVLDDVSNAVALRSDIHKAFDERKFLLAYKNSTWAVHFLALTNELGGLYHNTPITLANNVSPFFLLVRFAWAIFPLVRPFLENGVSRRVRVRVEDQNANLEEVKSASIKELTTITNPPKSRNPSPTKRQRPSNEDEADAEEDDGYRKGKRRHASSENSNESRGRKRYRTSSPAQTNFVDMGVSQSTASKSATYVPSQDWEQDLTDLEKKQLKWLRDQRPTDPKLLCCDYNEAERASRLGLPGKEEFSGRYLCMECLGAEYLEEMPESPDGLLNEDEGESLLNEDEGGLTLAMRLGENAEVTG